MVEKGLQIGNVWKTLLEVPGLPEGGVWTPQRGGYLSWAF